MIDLAALSVKELDALVKSAQKQKALLKRRPPVAKVRAQLIKHAGLAGYRIDEVFGTSAQRRNVAAVKKTRAQKRAKVAPKYRNPANAEETWSGRGTRPRWLAALVSKGRKIEQFLIKP